MLFENSSPRTSRAIALGAALLVASPALPAQIIAPAGPSSPRTALAIPNSCPWIDVSDFGAEPGDGIDDTAAIQQAVDLAMSRGGGNVIFPPGLYDVGEVNIGAGLRLVGHGATLRRLPLQPSFSRLFSSEGPYFHSSEVDSKPLVIEGFVFDGNRLAQGPYLAGEKVHQSGVILHADPNKAGRLVTTVRDCHFVDSAGDGIQMHTNTRTSILSCSGTDVFRRLVLLTGGNSVLHVNDLHGDGKVHPAGCDVQVESPGFGDNMAVDVTLSSLVLRGAFDMRLGQGSTLVADNIINHDPDFTLYALDSRVSISNSVFTVGANTTNTRIVYPNDVSFSNCTFVVSEEQTSEADRIFHAMTVAWKIQGSGNSTPQNLRINDCRLVTDDSIEASDIVYGIYSGETTTVAQDRLQVRGLQMDGDFDFGLWVERGGLVQIADSYLVGTQALTLRSSAGRNFDATLDALEFAPDVQQTLSISGGFAEDRCRIRTLQLDASQNQIDAPFGLGQMQLQGSRTILGQSAPLGAPGLRGDLWRLETPVVGQAFEWICTVSSATAATWAVKSSL